MTKGQHRLPLLFVPGPVEIPRDLRAVFADRLPYARTPEFSAFTFETLGRLRQLFQTTGDIVLLTASGTGAMEAAVGSLLRPEERALVVNGGTFGARWCRLCEALGVSHDEVPVEVGGDLDLADLDRRLATGDYTALFLTAHETSTGHLFDVQSIGRIARKHGILYVVDAISSLGADALRMDRWGIDATVSATQEALALPPGMSFLALSPRARLRAEVAPRRSLYFHIGDYLRDLSRGQLPYTPAIGLLVALHERLAYVIERGVDQIVREHEVRATYFRAATSDLPLRQLPSRPSNALTALELLPSSPLSAPDVVARLRDEHGLQVAPNPPPLGNRVFRVGHLGHQSIADLDGLVSALGDVLVGRHRLSRGDGFGRPDRVGT